MSDPTDKPCGKTAAGQRSALDWVAENVGNDALLHELRTRARRRWRRRAIVSGGAVAALVMCFFTVRYLPRGTAQSAPANHPHVSLPQRQILPDGSLAELRDGARIEVDFSGPERRITLAHGEAHFSVQKNPAKPFIVSALGVQVRAVGTAFAVQMATRGVEVLVTEGQVAVDHAATATPVSPNAAPLALVAAGETTVIEPRAVGESPSRPPRVVAIDEAEMTERLSWRVPRLDLSGTTLDVAVETFNRHSKVKLVIGDPSLARLQVSGIVRADQADALVRLLADNFGVTADLRGNERVLLRRAR
jgi:transmembrane sensor